MGVGRIVFVKKDSVSGNVACSHSHGHSFVATTFVARSLGRSEVCGLRCFLVSPLSLAKQNFSFRRILRSLLCVLISSPAPHCHSRIKKKVLLVSRFFFFLGEGFESLRSFCNVLFSFLSCDACFVPFVVTVCFRRFLEGFSRTDTEEWRCCFASCGEWICVCMRPQRICSFLPSLAFCFV